jgi:hypothetical protein
MDTINADTERMPRSVGFTRIYARNRLTVRVRKGHNLDVVHTC